MGLSICAALTGAMPKIDKNSNIPITPDQIAKSTYNCYQLGASIVHIHIKSPNGAPSLNYSIYEKVIGKIRNNCDIIISMSTSNYGVSISDDEREKLFYLHPDIATLALGSVHRKFGDLHNSDKFIINAINLMNKNGIIPEYEIFNLEMLDKLNSLINNEVIQNNPYVQFIFNSDNGMKLSAEVIKYIQDRIGENWHISYAGIAQSQLLVNMLTPVLAGNVARTGLEDNLLLYKNHLASNEDLVGRLVNIYDQMGININNVQETKNMLYSTEA